MDDIEDDSFHVIKQKCARACVFNCPWKAFHTVREAQSSTFPNRAGVKRIAGWMWSGMKCC